MLLSQECLRGKFHLNSDPGVVLPGMWCALSSMLTQLRCLTTLQEKVCVFSPLKKVTVDRLKDEEELPFGQHQDDG